MIEKIKSVKARVKRLLENKPHLRDDDDKLIPNVWHAQIGAAKIKNMSAFDLLTLLSEGQLINPESIRRVRAKLQEDNEYLRGENYIDRNKSGDETRQLIHTV